MMHTAQRLRQALLRRCGGAPVVLPVAVVLHALVVALVDQVVVHQSLAVLPSCFTAGWFWWTVGLMALFTGLLTFFTRTILPGAILTAVAPTIMVFSSYFKALITSVPLTVQDFLLLGQLGDITQLHGGEVPPVDIITFGSPCQNLSSAGRREGLGGTKSSLFFQAVRMIEEMRDATGGQFPTIVIWENVMGALLSGDRLDFRAVLQSLTDAEIPMPASGRWANAGMVRGGGRDVCWRLLDAQHWADPRLARRQRVFVVADLGGRRAGAILFKRRRLFPLPAPCGDFGLSPAGADRISADEAGGPLPVVHPFQGYRMRGAAKAGDVGNFLGSFGKPTDPFPTLMAGGLTVFSLWREGREAEGVITWLTPTEGERAMGLPDGWTAFGYDGRPISARARQKALGNSIALPCAEYIMAGVKEELEGGKNDSDT